MRRTAAAMAAALVLLAATAYGVPAAKGMEARGMDVDLSVRRVTVAPVRAYVGEKVRVELLVENRGLGSATTGATVSANGKVVAQRLFTWGLSEGERLHRLSFEWDTTGAAPGEYRIRGEAFVWDDSSPSDNRLDVTESVVLVPPGAPFPGGAKAGGSATETDPRFREPGAPR